MTERIERLKNCVKAVWPKGQAVNVHDGRLFLVSPSEMYNDIEYDPAKNKEQAFDLVLWLTKRVMCDEIEVALADDNPGEELIKLTSKYFLFDVRPVKVSR